MGCFCYSTLIASDTRGSSTPAFKPRWQDERGWRCGLGQLQQVGRDLLERGKEERAGKRYSSAHKTLNEWGAMGTVDSEA